MKLCASPPLRARLPPGGRSAALRSGQVKGVARGRPGRAGRTGAGRGGRLRPGRRGGWACLGVCFLTLRAACFLSADVPLPPSPGVPGVLLAGGGSRRIVAASVCFHPGGWGWPGARACFVCCGSTGAFRLPGAAVVVRGSRSRDRLPRAGSLRRWRVVGCFRSWALWSVPQKFSGNLLLPCRGTVRGSAPQKKQLFC